MRVVCGGGGAGGGGKEGQEGGRQAGKRLWRKWKTCRCCTDRASHDKDGDSEVSFSQKKCLLDEDSKILSSHFKNASGHDDIPKQASTLTLAISWGSSIPSLLGSALDQSQSYIRYKWKAALLHCSIMKGWCFSFGMAHLHTHFIRLNAQLLVNMSS